MTRKEPLTVTLSASLHSYDVEALSSAREGAGLERHVIVAGRVLVVPGQSTLGAIVSTAHVGEVVGVWVGGTASGSGSRFESVLDDGCGHDVGNGGDKGGEHGMSANALGEGEVHGGCESKDEEEGDDRLDEGMWGAASRARERKILQRPKRKKRRPTELGGTRLEESVAVGIWMRTAIYTPW